ncbi:MAG: M1 family metallopeptidase [Gammaproteobacteria bacterium]|nr:MAG: M1 family metallopeptidase [Gammaproteobacteria bacterium]
MPRAWPAGTAAAAAAIAHLALGAPPASAAATPNDIRIDGAAIHVELEPRAFRDGGDAVREWIRRSASIVAGYYGRFPATRLTVRVMAEAGEGVHGGKSFANPDASIRVQVGREVRGAQLLSDWVLVHEMTHLALPDTGEAHAWLSEGIATYVEGVARVQAGNRSEADVWAEEIRQMPRGMPQADDRGLDHTHTWGRTYWGGAMFCLLADVEIRTQTHNRFGLQDALRAVARESGGLSADWPIERVLRTGDGAVGTTTLEDLYAQMKDSPVTPDLMKLWQQLGIEPEGSAVRLSDSAPLAEVRRAIMRAP